MKLFRSTLTQMAWLSRSRRLADSNCCITLLAPEAPSGKDTSSDFVTGSRPVFVTAAGCTPAAEAAEDMSPHKETDQSACYSQRPSRASSSFPQRSVRARLC